MKMRWAIFWGLALGVFLSAASLAWAEKVKLTMSVVWTGRHAWYFAAREKGFYGAEGLELDIERGAGPADTFKKLVTKNADFAEVDMANIIVGRAQGSKVKMLTVYIQKAPFAIFSLKEAGIRTPKDLEGKSLGADESDAQRRIFPAYARVAGIDASKVKWISMPFPAKIPSLLAKKVDAVPGFLDTMGGALAVQGIEPNVLTFADAGLSMYATGLAATDEVIAEKPPLVRRFLRASNQGVAWTTRNPEAAVDIMSKHLPEVSSKLLKAQIRLTLPLLGTSVEGSGKPVGYMDPEKVREAASLVSTYMQVKAEVPLAEIYTNAFLE